MPSTEAVEGAQQVDAKRDFVLSTGVFTRHLLAGCLSVKLSPVYETKEQYE